MAASWSRMSPGAIGKEEAVVVATLDVRFAVLIRLRPDVAQNSGRGLSFRDGDPRLQAKLYKFIASSVVVFTMTISFPANHQSAKQISFLTHTV
jgi:hypothetical protein